VTSLTNPGCRFGKGAVVAASWRSPVHLICTSPPAFSAGWVSVSILSHASTSVTSSAFYYHATLDAQSGTVSFDSTDATSASSAFAGAGETGLSVAPSFGPTSGTTVVQVVGLASATAVPGARA
jgi:hypothetical protein